MKTTRFSNCLPCLRFAVGVVGRRGGFVSRPSKTARAGAIGFFPRGGWVMWPGRNRGPAAFAPGVSHRRTMSGVGPNGGGGMGRGHNQSHCGPWRSRNKSEPGVSAGSSYASPSGKYFPFVDGVAGCKPAGPPGPSETGNPDLGQSQRWPRMARLGGEGTPF